MEQMYGWSPAMEGSHSDPGTGLEESMWQLGLRGSEDISYPDRPGEPDCIYFMRTGSCGYGERCRFNHPRNRAEVVGAMRTGGGYPERVGQPVCQYYLKTGTCKFGVTCKYHHPRHRGGSARPVPLNYYGYPLRPGEKECSYYVKTGQCKFGVTCKFDHPQPAGTEVPAPAAAPAFYPTVQSSSVPSPHQYSAVASWQVARPPLLPGSYVQGAYGPMLLSPGIVPFSGWSPYLPPVSPAVSPSGQNTVQAGSVYGFSSQLSPSAPAYTGSYPAVSSSAGPSSSSHKENVFPERPGQPECQFYMRTGDCKFGSTCRYHHPPEWSIPKTNCALSPMGLPLRPGAAPCSFYTQHGECKFGTTCKFDHPIGTLSYSPSASSLADIPVAPYAIGFSAATLAPSSSSSDLRPEFIAGASNKDSFSIRVPSSGKMPSGSIGSIFSKGGLVSHSSVQLSGQSSTPSSSSSTGPGGEITSSS